MHALKRFSVFLSLSMVCICACQAGTQIPDQLTTVNGSKGGKIVYGQQTGGASQAAVLIKLLTQVHSLCGDKPKIGQVFQFKGTNYVGVFFTVTDRPEGSMPLAGMAIAAATGPNQAEGAMIYDRASSFGTTVNPLLLQLSGVWHPGGSSAAAPAPASGSASAGSAAGGPAAPAAPLNRVTLSDNTASVGVPSGWRMNPASRGGTIALTGPHGEYGNLNMGITALDTANRMVQQMMRSGAENAYLGKWIFYPSNADLTKAFPDIYQQIRAIAGQTGSANLQIAKIQAIPAPQGGERCVQVRGQMNPNGQGAEEFTAVMCLSTPSQSGEYGVNLSIVVLPVAFADQDRFTATAILASLQVNTALLKNRAAAAAAPGIALIGKNVEAQAQQGVNFIQQEGAATTARIKAGDAQHAAQQATWEAGQTANAQNVQGFTNYLLDQSVVQNNITGAQGTLWNNAANALVQANPNKYSYVPNSNINLGSQY